MGVRKAKLESLLQGLIASFLSERREDWGIGELVTVDGVFLMDDLKSAQVWVSFIPQTLDIAEKNFAVLERHLADIQRAIFKQLTMKRVPKLSLKLSDPERSFRLQQIFDTLEGHGRDSSTNSAGPESGESDTLGDA